MQTSGKQATVCIFPKWKNYSKNCASIGDCEFDSDEWKEWQKGSSIQVFVCSDHASQCRDFAVSKGWTW